MEMNSQAGPSESTFKFRPTPALGVTYLLDMEEDVKFVLSPIDDPNDEDYYPSLDKNLDSDEDEDSEDDNEEPEELDGPPYPTPSSIAPGKRKASEIYDVDDEAVPRWRSDRLRRRKGRLGRNVDKKQPEYIWISSDSEDDKEPAPTRKKHKPEDLQLPKLPLAELKVEESEDTELPNASSGPSPATKVEAGSMERVRPKTPPWLRLQLTRHRKQHPSTKLEICYGDIGWKVKCTICLKTCSVGPGQSLEYMNKHLNSLPHQMALRKIPGPSTRSREAPSTSNETRKGKAQAVPQTALRRDLPEANQKHKPAPGFRRYGAAAQPATPPRHERGNGREKKPGSGSGHNGGNGDGDWDDVERFLDQLGLSVALAPKLRSFGFADDRRMSAMGRLSDESLGLLMEHLTKEGVDLVAALMVREGLKRRAGTL